jgi:hypothetical protein
MKELTRQFRDAKQHFESAMADAKADTDPVVRRYFELSERHKALLLAVTDFRQLGEPSWPGHAIEAELPQAKAAMLQRHPRIALLTQSLEYMDGVSEADRKAAQRARTARYRAKQKGVTVGGHARRIEEANYIRSMLPYLDLKKLKAITAIITQEDYHDLPR